MKKPVKAETTVNPPLLRSGIQNACTYSNTGCAGGSICAADAAAYIPVNTDAKVSTTQKRPPCRVVFLCGGDNWNYCPRFSGFRASSPLFKNRMSMRFFRVFRLCVYKPKMQIFRKFVYDSCAVLWAGTPLPIGFNTTPICSRRTRCTARGAPSSARPAQRRRLPSSSSAPWKARPCCPLYPCPM